MTYSWYVTSELEKKLVIRCKGILEQKLLACVYMCMHTIADYYLLIISMQLWA